MLTDSTKNQQLLKPFSGFPQLIVVDTLKSGFTKFGVDIPTPLRRGVPRDTCFFYQSDGLKYTKRSEGAILYHSEGSKKNMGGAPTLSFSSD